MHFPEVLKQNRARIYGFLVALMLLPVPGRSSGLEFERISLAEGLSQSSIQTMVQGPDGYLWIGTQYGLDRYDGYTFSHWHADSGSPHGLSHGFVRALQFDRDGMLWIDTGNGLNQLNPQTGRIRQFRLDDNEHRTGKISFQEDSLVEDSQGNILAVSSLGPLRWERTRNRLERVPIAGGAARHNLARLLAGVKGGIWLANGHQVWRLDTQFDQFTSVLDLSGKIDSTNGTGLAAPSIATALPAGGIAWACGAGLYLLGPEPEPGIRHLKPRQFGMPDNRINAVATDSHGHLWLLLPSRIVRVGGPDHRQWKTMLELPASRNPDEAGGLSDANGDGNDHPKPLDLAETRDGRVWLGGRFGVAVLEPGADHLRLLTHDPDDRSSLPPTLGEVGYKLMADRFGVLWVGTNLGGLARLPPQTSRFKHVRDPRPGTGSRNIVRAIAEQRHDGSEWAWVSNQNAGLTV